MYTCTSQAKIKANNRFITTDLPLISAPDSAVSQNLVIVTVGICRVNNNQQE